jgi:hypothetical protein
MSLVHVSSKAPEEPVGEDPFAEEDGESVDESLEYANSHPGFLRTESTAYPWEDDETIPYYPDEDSPGDPYDDYGGGKWV